MRKKPTAKRLLWIVLGFFLFSALPAHAYIGPGAGFAFLSSFLVLFLTFFLAVFSFLSWPFRLLVRLIKGRRTLKGALVDRVIIVGLDGLEPSLAEKFMAEGKLPHFSLLKKDGTYARLQTTTPAISPVAWSSFMTGSEPSKHNIFDFLSRDPKTYLPSLSSAYIGRPKRSLSLGRYSIPLSKPEIRGMRKSVPFWKTLGEAGIFSTVLRVPITFPPEKFSGHLLSGMCAPDLKGSQGTFSFYTTDEAKHKKREGGVVIPVEVRDGIVKTYVSGPENSLLKKAEEVRLPLEARVVNSKGEVLIEVAGQRLKLKVGEFSPWIKIAFKPGLGMKVKAIARFLVSQVEPHFEMYMTPLNIDPEKPALPISHPFIYSVYLSKLLGSFITLGEANDTWALNEGALKESAFLELTYSNHREWEAMFFNALAKTKRGAVICVFETTDSIQHMFWRYLDKSHPALTAAVAELSPQVIEDLYIRMDGFIGRVMDKLDSKTVLIVMSDHGFKSFRRGVNLNSWLFVNGYLKLREGKTTSGEWFKDVDWGRTKAYAMGLGGLYLNLKGREASGIVAPGEESRALKDELRAKLTGLRDDASGEIAITEAYDRDKVYAGPYIGNAPDLVIGYNQGFRASWDSVTGKVDSTVFDDNIKCWSGDHCIDPRHVPGVFFFSRKVSAKTPSIMDVAPTVLTLFGLPVPGYMDGRPLISQAPPAAAPPKEKRKKK